MMHKKSCITFLTDKTETGQERNDHYNVLSIKWRSLYMNSVSWNSLLGRLYITEKWRHREREIIPKLTSEKGGVKTLVNSCIQKMHSLQMSLCRKSCAAWLRDTGGHAVSRSTWAVSMKIPAIDCNESNKNLSVLGQSLNSWQEQYV